MSKGVFAALSGSVAAQTALDVTAQNLANASSTGYHRLRPLFREVLSKTASGSPKAALRANRYTAVSGTVMDMSPGVIRSTGRPLDVALPENAFLAVGTARGERYTRNGAMAVTADGSLKIGDSSVLDDQGRAIRVSPDAEISLTKDGQVLVNGETQAHLKLVSFQNPALLTPEASCLVAASAGAGNAMPVGGEVTVGALEESNASPVTSMNDLITTSRNFDAYQRAIDTFREADRRVVTLPSS